jgi:hypothetical protein
MKRQNAHAYFAPPSNKNVYVGLKQTMKGAKLGTEGFFFISKIDSIESQF